MTTTTRHVHRPRGLRRGQPSRRYTPPGDGAGLFHRDHDRQDHAARVYFARRNAELRAIEAHQAELAAQERARFEAEAVAYNLEQVERIRQTAEVASGRELGRALAMDHRPGPGKAG